MSAQDKRDAAERSFARLLREGQSILEDLAASPSLAAFLGRLDPPDRRNVGLIAVCAYLVAKGSEDAAAGGEQSEEEAEEMLRAWLFRDGGAALLADLLLSPSGQVSRQGGQRKGSQRPKPKRRRR